MKHYILLLVTQLLISCQAPVVSDGPTINSADYPPPSPPEAAPASSPPSEGEALSSLERFTLRAMAVCAAKLSPVRQATLARSISSIASRYIVRKEDRETYVILICIESKYDNKARSPVGATGLAQIMPKYAQNFADLCQLGQLDPSDVEDPIINLSLGACLYQHLTKELGSSILAIAAYNAGPNSSSVRNLAKLSNPVPETASYVAKSALLKEKMRESDAGTVPDGQGEVSTNR
jgi:hypothetical protein